MRRVVESPADVRRIALNLLARREHTRLELTQKLIQRGAAKPWIDSTLDALQEENLLSEARYLESTIRTRAEAGFGALHIRQMLCSRGIAAEDADIALQSAELDWPSLLKTTWQRKFNGELPKNPRERDKQIRFLAGRGYPLSLIHRLLKCAAMDDW
ncbi:recombinase RecX [Ventosimonas gracilis]|uniref:Regulatory protein RecX n=1 Tax=Ventosimonas gracilis TaxID=1680762 RepID=A0A139SJG0_9GAMM|nr:regulatory protein RecX [Ventosimonas gracilis]KXU34630.1 recombinase RecX [Ventosimonas gracilis]